MTNNKVFFKTTTFRIVLGLLAVGLVALLALWQRGYLNISADTIVANSKDLGNGFIDHGMGAPYSLGRGTVAVKGPNNADVVLVSLMDHRGGYGLLRINVTTGESKTINTPCTVATDPNQKCAWPDKVAEAFASLLSRDNKYYLEFAGFLMEFDPVQDRFTQSIKVGKNTTGNYYPDKAMSMTEGSDGKIYMATYPDSALIIYDPSKPVQAGVNPSYIIDPAIATRQPKDWAQYPRSLAVDDNGRWAYLGNGFDHNEVIAFDIENKVAKQLLSDNPEDPGYIAGGLGWVFRSVDGNLYARNYSNGDSVQPKNPETQTFWYKLSDGQTTKLSSFVYDDQHKSVNSLVCNIFTNPDCQQIVSGSQGLYYPLFPSGKKIYGSDFPSALRTKSFRVVDSSVTPPATTIHSLNYDTDGIDEISVMTAPDNKTVLIGSYLPQYILQYNPLSDNYSVKSLSIQPNTLAKQKSGFFVGGYTGGYILEWNPFDFSQDSPRFNPNSEASLDNKIYVNRPSQLLAFPDENGSKLIEIGAPDYGLAGGGIMIWDRDRADDDPAKKTIITNDQIAAALNETGGEHKMENQSEASAVVLPDGKVLFGTSIAGGTGSASVATRAELFTLDLNDNNKIANANLGPLIERTAGDQVIEYVNLTLSKDKKFVYGLARTKNYSQLFFVYSLSEGKLVGSPTEIVNAKTYKDGDKLFWQQGPRHFIADKSTGNIYLLLSKSIRRIDPSSDGSVSLTKLADIPTEIEGGVSAGGDILNGRLYFAGGSHLYSYLLNPSLFSPTPTPSPSPTASPNDTTETFSLKVGWNVITAQNLLQAIDFTQKGTTVFAFNQNGQKNWNVSNNSSFPVNVIKPKTGYYVYSHIDQTIKAKVSKDPSIASATNDSTIRQGWNLLSNSDNSSKSLSQINYPTITKDRSNDCDVSSCFENKTLAELFTNNRIYHKVVVIKDGTSTDADKAFEYIELNGADLTKITIPAHTAFWVYLKN